MKKFTIQTILMLLAGALSLGMLIYAASQPGKECDYCGSTHTSDCDRFWKCHDCGKVFH